MSARRFVAVAVAAALAGCGYHLAGRGAFLPERVRVIGVPAFQSAVAKPQVVEKLTDAVTKELIARGGYRIRADRSGTDAVLEGAITGLHQTPVAFDEDGRASRALLTITARVALSEPGEERALYESPTFQFRTELELSREGTDFFDPESEAIDAIARDFARSLVATILEGF